MTEADLAKTLEGLSAALVKTRYEGGIGEFLKVCRSSSAHLSTIAHKLRTGKLIVADHPQATSPVDEPINATDAAFLAGEAIYQRDGVSPFLREVMQLRKHNSAMPSLAAKDAEIARMREALAHYATDYDHERKCSQWDGGAIARQALGDEA